MGWTLGTFVLLSPLFPHPSQESWIKEHRPVAALIIEKTWLALRMVEAMERAGPVTAATFRPLQAVVHPEDLEKVIGMMDPGEAKPTSKRLRDVVRTILTDRYWTYHLTHPQMDETHIHPTRSV